MTKADLIRAELQGLRRYARAVTGSQASGDALVRAAIESLAGTGASISTRLDLYQRLEAQIASSQADETPGNQLRLPPTSQRASLLRDFGDFSGEEANRILGVTAPPSGGADAVGGDPEASVFEPQNILIIEDEPLVAAHIAEIVRSMGHTVCGSAASAAAARAACARAAPDLILSDMVLGDDAAGGEVARELAARLSIPVIYLTAYPQSFLKGQEGEPVYLVTKPFRTSTIKTMIEQALIQQRYQRAG